MSQQQIDPRTGKPFMYSNGGIPEIAQAYQNDPRTQIAQAMMKTGTGTGPVAEGGWAVTDGLARVASALGGGLMSKMQDKKYGAEEERFKAALQEGMARDEVPQAAQAPTSGMAPSVGEAPPGMAQAAQALQGPQAQPMGMSPLEGGQRPMPEAIQAFDPGPSQFAPQQANMGIPQAAPGGQMPPFTAGGGADPSQQAAANYGTARTPMPATYGKEEPQGDGRQQLTAKDYYFTAIVPQEGGTNKDGSFRTSFKGAVGPGQIMPATGPEAAEAAGLRWDENKFKTDANYNNALGVAYFDKQLKLFKGDPLKAAAAYNAGPGAVRRAVRKAEKRGGEWTSYLPVTRKDGKVVDTTEKYVERFRQAIGGGMVDGSRSTSEERNTYNEDIQGVGRVPVEAPTYEEVPDAPQTRTLAERPGAPEIPAEIKSERMAIARKLLASNNTYLVGMAREYLDKGLQEEQDNKRLRSEQSFQQSQTGYTSDLSGFNNERQTGLENGFQERRDASTRNANRENQYRDQLYGSGESAAAREQQAALASADQRLTLQRDEATRSWQEGENALERQIATANAGRKNPWTDTQGGVKMQGELNKEIESNNNTIAGLQRFLQLQDKQTTGGIVATPVLGSIFKAFDSELRTMQGIANDTALGNLGGSLGVAISDGDRKFVSEATISPDAPAKANRDFANFAISALRRKSDHKFWYSQAQFDQTAAQFQRTWKMYTESVPIVKYNKDGSVAGINKAPMQYDEWLASIPKADSNGRTR